LFDEVFKNNQQLNVMKIPNAILQMAYLKLFIPLSMLTTSALTNIHANNSLKYHKIPFHNGAGKPSLDKLIFPSEDSLSESFFFQAYCNWLNIIDIISSPEVAIRLHTLGVSSGLDVLIWKWMPLGDHWPGLHMVLCRNGTWASCPNRQQYV